MKKRVLIVIFIGVYSLLSAQNEECISITPTKQNIFYIGIPNNIDISVSGIYNEDIDVNISKGEVSKTSSGYKVYVKEISIVEIQVSRKGKLIGKREFLCKRIPNPAPMVGSDVNNRTGGEMRRETLAAMSGVSAHADGFNLNFIIQKFDLTTYINGESISETSNNYRFTKKQKELIKKTKKGHRIIIDEIRAKGPDGTTRKLSSLVFKILRNLDIMFLITIVLI